MTYAHLEASYLEILGSGNGKCVNSMVTTVQLYSKLSIERSRLAKIFQDSCVSTGFGKILKQKSCKIIARAKTWYDFEPNNNYFHILPLLAQEESLVGT